MTVHTTETPFWRSGTGIFLGTVLCLAALMLVIVQWDSVAGWLPLLLPLVICLGLHKFMHGGHGHDHGHKR